MLILSFQSSFNILSMSTKIIDPVSISLILSHPNFRAKCHNKIAFGKNTLQRKRSQARKLMATYIRNFLRGIKMASDYINILTKDAS